MNKFPEDIKKFAELMDRYTADCLNVHLSNPNSPEYPAEFAALKKLENTLDNDFPWCNRMLLAYRAYTFLDSKHIAADCLKFANEYNRWTALKIEADKLVAEINNVK